jgi:hypothetical protein
VLVDFVLVDFVLVGFVLILVDTDVAGSSNVVVSVDTVDVVFVVAVVSLMDMGVALVLMLAGLGEATLDSEAVALTVGVCCSIDIDVEALTVGVACSVNVEVLTVEVGCSIGVELIFVSMASVDFVSIAVVLMDVSASSIIFVEASMDTVVTTKGVVDVPLVVLVDSFLIKGLAIGLTGLTVTPGRSGRDAGLGIGFSVVVVGFCAGLTLTSGRDVGLALVAVVVLGAIVMIVDVVVGVVVIVVVVACGHPTDLCLQHHIFSVSGHII